MTAPYGFIDFPSSGAPLPAAALWADDTDLTATTMLAGHRSWHTGPDGCSGWIDVTATTLTPLFTGGTITGNGEDQDGTSFRLGAGGPYAIPDTALTGMLRNTVRIITGSRVGPISTPVLFFRAPIRPDKDEFGPAAATGRKLYDQYARLGGMASGLTQQQQRQLHVTSRAGFLKFVDGKAKIAPLGQGCALPLTMKLDALRYDLHLDGITVPVLPDPGENAVNAQASNNYTPHQWHPGIHGGTFAICYGDNIVARGYRITRVWGAAAITDARPVGMALQEARRRAPDGVERVQQERANHGKPPLDVDISNFSTCTAVLHFTGIAGVARSKAFFFPEPGGADPFTLDVLPELVNLFESADQITNWQKKNTPSGTGKLDRDTRNPIWFTTDDDEVIAFGRSGGFRVAIRHPDRTAQQVLLHGIPEKLRPRTNTTNTTDVTDVTEALFGAVDTNGPVSSFRRRVLIGTATPTADVRVENPVQVQLLGPQRGCFSHYVQQTAGHITTWADTDATLRGYKVYLHLWDANHHGNLQQRLPDIQGVSVDAGRRSVQPLSPGNTFTFRITYTNLTRAELGCLLYALELNNPAGGGSPTNPIAAHKIGLGKGIGFGSIHLAYTVRTVNPGERYAADDPGQLPHPGTGVHRAGTAQTAALIDEFGRRLAAAHPGTAPEEWRNLRHLRQLHVAAAWHHRLPLSATATMPLKPRRPGEPAFGQFLQLRDLLNR